MKTSDSVIKIATALLAAQQEITFAEKSAENPYFNAKYADLPTVIQAIKEPLNKNGIVFIQFASPGEAGRLFLTTRLMHTSGEWIEDTGACPILKNDPQAFGSAMTYMRRYALAAVVGLYQDDDDANGATHEQPQRQQPYNRPQTAAKPVSSAPDAKPTPTPTPAKKPAESAAKAPATGPVGDWREAVIHFGKKKGVKLGELEERSLLWYIQSWVPTDKPGYPITATDVALRKALDLAGASMALPGFGVPENTFTQEDAPDEIPGL